MRRRSSSSKRTRMRYPLPDDALPRVKLTGTQCAELRQFALLLAQEALCDGHTWARTNIDAAVASGWKVTEQTPHSCFLVRHEHPYEGRCFMGHKQSMYSLDDVVQSLYCEHTTEQRIRFANALGSTFVDGCVMQTIEGRTGEDPFWYLGLKWIAVQSPLGKLISNRDFAILEHSGTYIDPHTEQRMLYRVIESVCLSKYGSSDSFGEFTRASVQVAYVYFEDPEGSLHVCMKGNAHPKGKIPTWVIDRYLMRVWRSGLSICEANLQNMDVVPTLGDEEFDDIDTAHELAAQWVADSQRKTCFVCGKRFRRLRRSKHHCRACGEVICRSCTVYDQLCLPNLSVPVGFPFNRDSTCSSVSNQSNFSVRTPWNVTSMKLPMDETSMSSGSGSMGRRSSLMTNKVCRRCVELKKQVLRRKSSTEWYQQQREETIMSQHSHARDRLYSEQTSYTSSGRSYILLDASDQARLTSGHTSQREDTEDVPMLDASCEHDESDLISLPMQLPPFAREETPSAPCFDDDVLFEIRTSLMEHYRRSTMASSPGQPTPLEFEMPRSSKDQELQILQRICELHEGTKRTQCQLSKSSSVNSSCSYSGRSWGASWGDRLSKTRSTRSLASSRASTYLSSTRSSVNLNPSLSITSEDCEGMDAVPAPTNSLAEVEAAIADQAYLLYCIQTQRTKPHFAQHYPETA